MAWNDSLATAVYAADLNEMEKKNFASNILDFDSLRAAHERIRLYIHRTPVLTSERLNEANGASLFFKCENFQKIGAFKARGATNAVFALDHEAARRGVATHSSGIHGAAMVRAAQFSCISVTIVSYTRLG